MRPTDALRCLIFAGFLLGVGLGGLAESIVFRNLIQSHDLLSGQGGWHPDERFWNGVALTFAWVSTAMGVRFLFTVARRAPAPSLSGRVLLGSMLLGGGVFMGTECILHHYLFGMHHLVERLGPSLFDSLDLGLAVAVAGLGVVMIREGLFVRRRFLQA